MKHVFGATSEGGAQKLSLAVKRANALIVKASSWYKQSLCVTMEWAI